MSPFFSPKPFFETHLQGETHIEDSGYLDVFQPENSTLTSNGPIFINTKPSVLTNENLGPDSIETSYNLDKPVMDTRVPKNFLFTRGGNKFEAMRLMLLSNVKSSNQRLIRTPLNLQVTFTPNLSKQVYPSPRLFNLSLVFLILMFPLLIERVLELVLNTPCQILFLTKICRLPSPFLLHNCLV